MSRKTRTWMVAGLLLVTGFMQLACSPDPEVIKRESIRKGDAYVAEKKYAEALIEYRRAVQQDQRFRESREKLAETYIALGDVANATREYIRVADLVPDDPAMQAKVGTMLLAAQRFDDAKDRAEKALRLNPKFVEAQILRADALAGLNKMDDALEGAERALSMAPSSATYMTVANMRMVRGDKDQAEAAYKKAVDTDPKSVAARVALANFYWAVNRQPDAEQQLKEAVALDPKNETANRALGLYYFENRRQPEAEPYFKVLADLNGVGKLRLADYYRIMGRPEDMKRILTALAATSDPAASLARLRLAGAAFSAGDVAAAIKLTDEILQKEPRNVDAWIAKAQFLASAGKLDEALQAAQSATGAGPAQAGPHFILGQIYAARRERSKAAAAFSEAIKRNPRQPMTHVELAKIRYEEGDLREAERLVRVALGTVRDYAEAHLLLSRILLTTGAYDEAAKSLSALQRDFPNSAEVQSQLGVFYTSRKDWAAARSAFERALKIQPRYLDAVAGLIELDLREKKPDAAKARVTTALAEKPKDSNLLLLAGKTHFALRDAPAAENHARNAIDADPENLEAYQLLATVYAAQGKLAEATAQFTTLAEKRPTSIATQVFLGVLKESQNRAPEAIGHYEKALQLDPQAGVAANNLAWLYLESGRNINEALRLAQTAKSKLPDRPEVNDTLGVIYIKKGQYQLAVDPLRQAVASEPNKAIYWLHLGQAYKGTTDIVKARESLEKALALDPKLTEAQKTLDELKG